MKYVHCNWRSMANLVRRFAWPVLVIGWWALVWITALLGVVAPARWMPASRPPHSQTWWWLQIASVIAAIAGVVAFAIYLVLRH